MAASARTRYLAHAIQNEGTGASRTYLALSSEALGENELKVVAFVTLAVPTHRHAAFS